MNGLAPSRRASLEAGGQHSEQPQRLPNELLRSIFLYCDPATLYTSVRPISRAWKQAVEDHLIADHFAHRNWRVGLRVVRKLPPPSPHALAPSTRTGDAELDRLNILDREGALEPTSSMAAGSQAAQPQSVVHVIPLRFKGYDSDSVSLKFDTGSDWHSLFRVQQSLEEVEDDEDEDNEDEDNGSDDDDDEEVDAEGGQDRRTARMSASHRRRVEQAEAKASSARLEGDFGLVWRFPDDGQDVDNSDGEVNAAAKRVDDSDVASWGVPDPENGWLSRFYCSKYDLKDNTDLPSSTPRSLRSTPIAPRMRRHDLHPAHQRDGDDDDDDDASVPASRAERSAGDLVWSDQGHEYLNLSLSLGMEFFVRRSARANQLLRRLEVEAAAAEAREAVQLASASSPSYKNGNRNGKKRWGVGAFAGSSAMSSGWATPREVASPPPSRTTASLDARRQRAVPRVQQLDEADVAGPSSQPVKAKKAAANIGLGEIEEWDAPLPSGAVTPATASMSSSLLSLNGGPSSQAMSRLGSVAPSRRGGGSVALSTLASSSGGKAGSSSRRNTSSTPRATFTARLCRAELMPSQPQQQQTVAADDEEAEQQVDRAGWRGGDALGKGAYRLATLQLPSPSTAAVAAPHVPRPVVWSWTR